MTTLATRKPAPRTAMAGGDRPADVLVVFGITGDLALRLGAAAMASAMLSDPIELCWQPVVYRAPAVGPGEAESFAPRLDAVRRRVDAAGALVR